MYPGTRNRTSFRGYAIVRLQRPRGAWLLARSLRRRPRCAPSSPRVARAPRAARAPPSAAFLCRQRKLLKAAAWAKRGRHRNPSPSRWPLRSPRQKRHPVFGTMLSSRACSPCKSRHASAQYRTRSAREKKVRALSGWGATRPNPPRFSDKRGDARNHPPHASGLSLGLCVCSRARA